MGSTNNLDPAYYPDFSKIQTDPETILHLLKEILAENKQQLDALLENKEHTWESLMKPLEDMEERLFNLWAPVKHLNKANNSPGIRKAFNECSPLIESYTLQLNQNSLFYEALVSLKNNANQFQNLTVSQQKVLTNRIRSCERAGVKLAPSKKERYIVLQQKLGQLQNQFNNNITDSLNSWSYHTEDESELDGLPDMVLNRAAKRAQEKKLSGWIFTYNDATSFLATVKNRKSREMMYKALYTLASDQGPYDPKFNNSPIMEEIMRVRHEMAVDLLGFKNFADYNIDNKTMKTSDKALQFVNALISKVKPFADKDIAALQNEATSEQIEHMESWDVSYLIARMKKERFSLSQEDTRPYIPLTKALQGLFEVLHLLYGITIKEQSGVPTWDPEVKLYEVYDKNNQHRGSVFADFFRRDNKSIGCWNDSLRHRRVLDNGSVQNPLTVLICDFPKTTGEETYLSHFELRNTLFHEFGHCLQMLLTQAELPVLSSLESIPWDAVEIPSTFLENWSRQKEVLPLVTAHKVTGLPLPDDLIGKLLASDRFLSGHLELTYLMKTLFDLRIHMEFDPAQNGQIDKIMGEVRSLCLVTVPPYFRFQNQIKHSFAGEYNDAYAGGYWTYKLCDVLAADGFTRFEQSGVFNQQAAQDFQRCILEPGGLPDPLEAFNQFMQRDPKAPINIAPYLKERGFETQPSLGQHSIFTKTGIELTKVEHPMPYPSSSHFASASQ